VVDKKDPRYPQDRLGRARSDDRSYLDALLNEIKAVAKRDQVPELEDFASRSSQLLQDAELGKISKEKLLEGLPRPRPSSSSTPSPIRPS